MVVGESVCVVTKFSPRRAFWMTPQSHVEKIPHALQRLQLHRISKTLGKTKPKRVQERTWLG